MTKQELFDFIKKQKSYLCVGLDTDINKIPKHLRNTKYPIFEFNKAVIDATKEYCVSYKPNIAFYEALGPKGWEALEMTMDYIPKTHFTIADAKRGDIGNTSKLYAKTFFEYFNFDSVTVAPYMGIDSVTPFLEYDNKWVILLGLTSNKGSQDFQLQKRADGKPFFQIVMEKAASWTTEERLMFVVGATHPEKFKEIRAIVPNHFLLVPGIGAQGGDLKGVTQNGWNKDGGLLVNSSRGIIYAGGDAENFQEKIAQAAKDVQVQMSNLMNISASLNVQ